LLLLGDGGIHADCLAAERPNLLDDAKLRPLARGMIVVDDDLRPALCQLHDDAPTDAVAAARDDRHLAVQSQFAHAIPSSKACAFDGALIG
jgi:hypothetical protein